jgi:hypothetical protein
MTVEKEIRSAKACRRDMDEEEGLPGALEKQSGWKP